MIDRWRPCLEVHTDKQTAYADMEIARVGDYVRYDDHAKLLSDRLQQLEELKNGVALEANNSPMSAMTRRRLLKLVGIEPPEPQPGDPT